MRIFEIVERHRPGYGRLLDITGRDDVAGHLSSRQAVAPMPAQAGQAGDVRPGDIVVALLELDASAQADSLEELRELAGSLPEDSALLVLTTRPVAELPVGPLVSSLTSAGLQVVEASPVSHPAVRAAVVARPAKVPVAFVTYLARGVVSQPDEVQLRRLISEHLLEGLVTRAREQESASARIAELEQSLATAQEAADWEAARYRALERSRSVALALALSAARRHPVDGLRQAGRAVRGGANPGEPGSRR
jgi:hypothetical protein